MNSNPEIVKKVTNPDFKEISTNSTKEITWIARHLNYKPRSNRYSIDSPNFDFLDAMWCLRLYPKNRSRDYMGLRLVRIFSYVPRHTLRCCFLSRGNLRRVYCETVHFDESHKSRGDMKCLNRFAPNSDPYYPQILDSIEVTCIVSEAESCSVDAFSQTAVPDAKDVLCQNLKDLLLNGGDHDIVLKAKDKEFRAHQNILRARSPVLDAMLSHDMAEKNSGVVDIPDCDPIAFEQFLIYLYSGQVDDLNAGNMLSLYYIADKYDTGHLKEECREFIKESMTPRNITDVVQVALDHNDADLLQRSTEYFVRRVDRILTTVEWVSFQKRNAVQANELFIKAKVKTETNEISDQSKIMIGPITIPHQLHFA